MEGKRAKAETNTSNEKKARMTGHTPGKAPPYRTLKVPLQDAVRNSLTQPELLHVSQRATHVSFRQPEQYVRVIIAFSKLSAKMKIIRRMMSMRKHERKMNKLRNSCSTEFPSIDPLMNELSEDQKSFIMELYERTTKQNKTTSLALMQSATGQLDFNFLPNALPLG